MLPFSDIFCACISEDKNIWSYQCEPRNQFTFCCNETTVGNLCEEFRTEWKIPLEQAINVFSKDVSDDPLRNTKKLIHIELLSCFLRIGSTKYQFVSAGKYQNWPTSLIFMQQRNRKQ